MKDNTPILMESEEQAAPWNQKTKFIEVTISQTLSSTQKIEVSEDFRYNRDKLESFVLDQIMLPSDYIENADNFKWNIDDFAVI